MTPVEIKVPVGAEVSNYLYPVMEEDDLTQDILTVALPNGYFVDVGWYPEHVPNGRYVVRVFFEYWDCQKMAVPFTTRDVNELVDAVQRLAHHYSRSQNSLGD